MEDIELLNKGLTATAIAVAVAYAGVCGVVVPKEWHANSHKI